MQRVDTASSSGVSAMSEETVIVDEIIRATPHRGDAACFFDCERDADFDVEVVRNGNEATVPACEQCARDTGGVRPEHIEVGGGER